MTFFNWKNELSRDGHRVELSGLSMVMHCHHYNINLQKTLEDTLGEEGVALLVRSVEEASHTIFRSLLHQFDQIKTEKSKLEMAATMYQNCGLGIVHLPGNRAGGRPNRQPLQPSRHRLAGQAWAARNTGLPLYPGLDRRGPGGDLTIAPSGTTRYETKLQNDARHGLRFQGQRSDKWPLTEPKSSMRSWRAAGSGNRRESFPCSVSTFPCSPSHYYNRLSFEFERKMGPSRAAEAESLLIRAAQECGYATFQGIRNSWEWDEIVAPMIEKEEDQIHGFAAVAVAFGWGDLKLVELVPGQRLVIRVGDSYEAGGYLSDYGHGRNRKMLHAQGGGRRLHGSDLR